MKTPSTIAGNRTELIMFRAVENIAQRGTTPLTTQQYNAIYEAVLDNLEEATQVQP